MTDGVKFECYLNLVPGALFWFAPLRAIAREALAERLGLLRLRCLLLGVKRTRISALHRSAFDPKRTLADDGIQCPLSHEFEITTCSAYGPSDPTNSDDPNPLRDSACVPSGHASNFVPTARPSNCRGWRWQPREVEGSVPRERCLTQP